MLNLANKFTGLLTAFLQIKFYDPNIIYLEFLLAESSTDQLIINSSFEKE